MEGASCDPANQGCAETHGWGHAERLKIDSKASPWLIRRLVDLRMVIRWLPLPRRKNVSERCTATSFDIEEGFSIDDPASVVDGSACLIGDHD
ncbi:chromate resistance protein ChrB domain-containing protein [Paracoccus sp. SY]|uniref:chromate resistance protein ChrB domain-containing protein n=1 Tax=Paracoccus sp. SY TaxID=1330255 RepID=UPI0018647398